MALDIKICGLKTPEAVSAALDGGASHVGFIFFERSPRNVSPVIAGMLRKSAIGRAKAVAVTVDAGDADLDRIVETMQPDILQLQGKETPDRVGAIKLRYGLPVMKALAISEVADLHSIGPFKGVADRFLFDAKAPEGARLPGGNGISFDWTILSRLDASVDYFLAGGLSAGNVEEALRLANPPGIDLSSGVETAPGVKDIGLIASFFEATRAAQLKIAA